MAEADDRVRCWAAAERYRDALGRMEQLASEADSIYRRSTPRPPPVVGRVVAVGRDLAMIQAEWADEYGSLMRARDDARACGVPNGYFDLLDSVPTDESLSSPPSNKGEAGKKWNTTLELLSDADELGDDYYHKRPSGG